MEQRKRFRITGQVQGVGFRPFVYRLAAGLRLAGEFKPHLVVLDLMLPGIGGLDVCRLLRGNTTAPIIMLTAKAAEVDRVVGLEMGADDYMTKPFSMRELSARVKAMLRRDRMIREELAAQVDQLEEKITGEPVAAVAVAIVALTEYCPTRSGTSIARPATFVVKRSATL